MAGFRLTGKRGAEAFFYWFNGTAPGKRIRRPGSSGKHFLGLSTAWPDNLVQTCAVATYWIWISCCGATACYCVLRAHSQAYILEELEFQTVVRLLWRLLLIPGSDDVELRLPVLGIHLHGVYSHRASPVV